MPDAANAPIVPSTRACSSTRASVAPRRELGDRVVDVLLGEVDEHRAVAPRAPR